VITVTVKGWSGKGFFQPADFCFCFADLFFEAGLFVFKKAHFFLLGLAAATINNPVFFLQYKNVKALLWHEAVPRKRGKVFRRERMDGKRGDRFLYDRSPLSFIFAGDINLDERISRSRPAPQETPGCSAGQWVAKAF
jgi:hypothetical protein